MQNGGPRERIGYAILVCMTLFGVGYVGAQRLHQPASIVIESQSDPVRATVPPATPPSKVQIPPTQEAAKPAVGDVSAVPAPASTSPIAQGLNPPMDASSVRASNSKKPPPAEPVSINDATEADLMALPGIGKALADRIIEYRQAHNGFQSIEELRGVRGIGPKKYEKMAPFVKL